MAIKIPIQISQVVGGNLQPVSTLSSSDFDIVLASDGVTPVPYSDFSNLGNGNYTFGTFTIPASTTAQGAQVQVKINGVLKSALGTFTVYPDNGEPWTSQKTVDLAAQRVDRAGDTIFNWLTYIPDGSFNPMMPLTAAVASGVLVCYKYVNDNFATTGSVSGIQNASLSAYASLTGTNGFTGLNTFNNAVLFNTSTVSLVATNLWGTGATGNFKRHNVEVVSNTASAGVFGNGVDMMNSLYKDTGGDTRNIISWGFDSGENPYINFHNTPVQNINLGSLVVNSVGSHERVVDPNYASNNSPYTFNSLNAAVNSCNSPAPDTNEFYMKCKDTGTLWNTLQTSFTPTDGINIVGDGDMRFVMASNSYNANMKWKSLKLRGSATTSFTNNKFYDVFLRLLNTHSSNPDCQFTGCEARNLFVDSASAITFFGGNNKFYNCTFSVTPLTSAGDIFMNCIVDGSISAMTF